MRLCQPHWDALKLAIEDRGLMQFVSGSGEKVTDKIVAELGGDRGPDTFDPLMSANMAIWSNALHGGGLYLMGADEAGNQYCPLCESELHGGYEASWWISHAADDQLERARTMNLLPQLS